MRLFSDFLNTIDDSDYSSYMADAIAHVESKNLCHDNAMLELTGVQTLYYLEKYHEWLDKQGLVIVKGKKN